MSMSYIVSTLFLLAPASIIAQENVLLMTGTDLKDSCSYTHVEPMTTFSALKMGQCVGFVQGITSNEAVLKLPLVLITEDGNLTQQFCIRKGVTQGQTIAIVEKFLNNNPEQLDRPAALLVRQALKTVFPCQK
jgi:hypothetical protein